MSRKDTGDIVHHILSILRYIHRVVVMHIRVQVIYHTCKPVVLMHIEHGTVVTYLTTTGYRLHTTEHNLYNYSGTDSSD